MTVAQVAKHACSRCGKTQPRDKLIFSTHTRSYYCLGFAACDQRAKRKGLL